MKRRQKVVDVFHPFNTEFNTAKAKYRQTFRRAADWQLLITDALAHVFFISFADNVTFDGVFVKRIFLLTFAWCSKKFF